MALALILTACSSGSVSDAGTSHQTSSPPPTTPPATECPDRSVGPVTATWRSFTDTKYGFTVSYPPQFAFALYPAGSLPPANPVLAAYRSADRCFAFGAETGFVFVGAYTFDAATLSTWVNKHSDNRACLGGPGVFVFVGTQKAITVAGHAATSFDQDLAGCGEGGGAIERHTTVLVLNSGYVFVFEWQSVDASYTPTMQAVAERMMSSLTG